MKKVEFSSDEAKIMDRISESFTSCNEVLFSDTHIHGVPENIFQYYAQHMVEAEPKLFSIVGKTKEILKSTGDISYFLKRGGFSKSFDESEKAKRSLLKDKRSTRIATISANTIAFASVVIAGLSWYDARTSQNEHQSKIKSIQEATDKKLRDYDKKLIDYDKQLLDLRDSVSSMVLREKSS